MLGRGVVRRARRLAEHTHGPRQPTARRLGIDTNETTHALWCSGAGFISAPGTPCGEHKSGKKIAKF